jgi:hypothetical protein
MARRDDAHVRPDHHIVRDVEPAKVIESAVLIYEDIMPDADFVPPAYRTAGSVESSRLPFFTDEFAEQDPNFVRIIERQTVECGGDRHRSFDVCQHSGARRRQAPRFIE